MKYLCAVILFALIKLTYANNTTNNISCDLQNNLYFLNADISNKDILSYLARLDAQITTKQVLEELDFDTNQINNALCEAAIYNSNDTMYYLLQYGGNNANVKCSEYNDMTPIMLAAHIGNLECFKLLLNYSDLSIKLPTGQDTLFFAKSDMMNSYYLNDFWDFYETGYFNYKLIHLCSFNGTNIYNKYADGNQKLDCFNTFYKYYAENEHQSIRSQKNEIVKLLIGKK